MIWFKSAFWILAGGTSLCAFAFLALGLGMPVGHELKPMAGEMVKFGLAQAIPATALWIGIALSKYEIFQKMPAGSWFPVQDWTAQLLWLNILACAAVTLIYATIVCRHYRWEVFLM